MSDAGPAAVPRIFWIALVAGAAASSAVIVGIATQWLIVGSVSDGWWYRYAQPFSIHPLIVGALVTAAAIALLRLPAPAPGRPEWALVACWLAAALALQAFLLSVNATPFETVFVSDGANSFYSVTQKQDPETVLRAFNRVRRESALHAQSNMPGKVMLLYALQLITTRTDILPWLLVVLSNVGGLLMYLFVRAVVGDRTTALYSMVLYLFLPAKLVFFPLMNTVTPVFLLCSLCVLMAWLRSRRVVYAVLLGVALYGLAFFEPLPLVTGLVFAALTLRAVARGELSVQQFVLHTALMTVTFVATAEVVRLMSGFDLVGAFRGISAHAAEFNATEGRRYSTWVWVNLWEFVFAAGPCQVVLFAAALAAGLIGSRTARQRFTDPVTVLCISSLAVLLVTDLIGVNRGEIVRLWIFLAGFFQIPAAYVCAKLQHPAAISIVVAASILQAAVATSMIGFIVP